MPAQVDFVGNAEIQIGDYHKVGFIRFKENIVLVIANPIANLIIIFYCYSINILNLQICKYYIVDNII